MTIDPDNKYTWGVRFTWILTGIAYATMCFLIPHAPGGRARASLFLMGLFGIFALFGGIAHLLLFAMHHPLQRIQTGTRAVKLWRLSFGLLWLGALGFIIYWAVGFVFATWASI